MWTTPPEWVKQPKKRASEKKRTYVTPLRYWPSVSLKDCRRTDDRVFPAFEPKVYVIRKARAGRWAGRRLPSVAAHDRDLAAGLLGGGLRGRCSITRTQGTTIKNSEGGATARVD